jgi:hypothetical protein
MFSHERSLVTKYQNRPFVLLGVNEDQNIQLLQKAQAQHHLNWRSWFDGLDGLIAREWKVTGMPTLYLLDHKGLTRWKHVGPPDSAHLEGLIEQLVKEAEAENKKPTALSKR